MVTRVHCSTLPAKCRSRVSFLFFHRHILLHVLHFEKDATKYLYSPPIISVTPFCGGLHLAAAFLRLALVQNVVSRSRIRPLSMHPVIPQHSLCECFDICNVSVAPFPDAFMHRTYGWFPWPCTYIFHAIVAAKKRRTLPHAMSSAHAQQLVSLQVMVR